MVRQRDILAGRLFLILSLACFAIYIADILLAKFAATSSFSWPYVLGPVGQFLLVLTGSALLVVSALFKEASSRDPIQ